METGQVGKMAPSCGRRRGGADCAEVWDMFWESSVMEGWEGERGRGGGDETPSACSQILVSPTGAGGRAARLLWAAFFAAMICPTLSSPGPVGAASLRLTGEASNKGKRGHFAPPLFTDPEGGLGGVVGRVSREFEGARESIRKKRLELEYEEAAQLEEAFAHSQVTPASTLSQPPAMTPSQAITSPINTMVWALHLWSPPAALPRAHTASTSHVPCACPSQSVSTLSFQPKQHLPSTAHHSASRYTKPQSPLLETSLYPA